MLDEFHREKQLHAFNQWTLECERQAVITVHLMFPDDFVFTREAARTLPSAAAALDHLSLLQMEGLITASEFWVAFHILQQTLVG